MRKHNKNLTVCAQKLRREMTKQERRLWYEFLRNYAIRILRQKVIEDYIVDFYCSKAKLVIEVDGGQHYSDEEILKDKLRTEKLHKYNIEVIRVTNLDVDKNFQGVCEFIDKSIRRRV